MNSRRWWAAQCAVLLVFGAGCSKSPPPGSGEIDVDGSRYRISEPLVHKNMTVFVLSSDHQDEQNYLTLDDGLAAGLVTIAEQDEEQVNSLQIDNRSDRPLYLQEGERLEGGKQDRTIASTVVVPPHSGSVKIASYCVEHNRWQEKDKGRSFGFTMNAALAPKGVAPPPRLRKTSSVSGPASVPKRHAARSG